MGEFQVADLCDQELIDTVIDTALASALVAHDGDVLILLPVLRPDSPRDVGPS